MDKSVVKECVMWVRKSIQPGQCDNTLKNVEEHLQSRGENVQEYRRWFNAHGAYCDCEVVFNIDIEDVEGAVSF